MALPVENAKLTTVGLMRPVTNIDRRNCERVVPMKVLCLGLGRTGTASLRTALIQLGFDDTYHMVSVFTENPKDAEMWVEAIDAKYKGVGKPYGREEWDKLLGHCMVVTPFALPLWDRAKSFKAVTDFPAVMFVDELIAAYPDAKILLTVRDDVEAWYKSVLNTLWTGNFIFGPPKTFLQAMVQRIFPRPPAWPIMQRAYGYTPLGNFPAEGRDWYKAHNEHVRKAAKGRQFLEYNVKEGWGPLCKFLGVEEPQVPFPRVNDTKAWQDFTEKSKVQSVLELLVKAGKVGVPVVLGSITLWYLRKVH